MSETSKPEAWQRGVYIGLHHDIHFLRYAQRRVFADVPVRLGNRTYRAGGIQRVTFLKLTPMVRFCGVLDQMRSAFLTAPGIIKNSRRFMRNHQLELVLVRISSMLDCEIFPTPTIL